MKYSNENQHEYTRPPRLFAPLPTLPQARRRFVSELVESLRVDGLMAFNLTDSKHSKEHSSEHHSVSYMGVLSPHSSFAATAMEGASVTSGGDGSSTSSCALKHRHIDIKAYPVEEMVSAIF